MVSRQCIALVLLCVTGLGLLGEAAATNEVPPCQEGPLVEVDLEGDDCAKPLCPPILCWPCPMVTRPKVNVRGLDLLS